MFCGKLFPSYFVYDKHRCCRFGDVVPGERIFIIFCLFDSFLDQGSGWRGQAFVYIPCGGMPSIER